MREKNNVIFDILYATSSTMARGQMNISHLNATMPEETQTLPQEKSAISKSSNIQQTNKSVKWTYPKNAANAKKDECKEIKTCNRFSSLADNEWVRDDNSVLSLTNALHQVAQAVKVNVNKDPIQEGDLTLL